MEDVNSAPNDRHNKSIDANPQYENNGKQIFSQINSEGGNTKYYKLKSITLEISNLRNSL